MKNAMMMMDEALSSRATEHASSDIFVCGVIFSCLLDDDRTSKYHHCA
jgi:hypothetical protein